jgi:Clp amino terminal domain, pathogenicity island component
MGVTKQAAQQRFVPRGPVKDTAGFGDFSRFTTRARSVLAAAEDLAQAADVGAIGTEHLAVGLLAEPEGIAAQAIAALGVSAGQLRSALGPPDQAETGNAPAGEPPRAPRPPRGCRLGSVRSRR